jgi:hypothetical protein
MRVAMQDANYAVEFTRIGGTWIDENGELVEIQFE